MKMRSLKAVSLALCALMLVAFSARDYEHLLGTPAPAWTVSHWINTEPMDLAALRGKVVLLRWWTGPYCPFCHASAAALKEWHQMYQDDGLVVIGFYHHKSTSPLSLDEVATMARELGFTFPIGIDPGWTTLSRWWLNPVPDAKFTSVSFLLDHEGIIRYIHPGGDYVKGDDDHKAMQAAIEEQLQRIEAQIHYKSGYHDPVLGYHVPRWQSRRPQSLNRISGISH
jgi:peroxiredoxin